MNSQHPKHQENRVTQQGTQGNHGIIEAMNRWSGSFSKLFLPSNIGSKATIKQMTDENAKVLSMGVYMGRRTAVSGANPYDGGTYEGHTMKDESTGTLWAYETKFPDGFEHVDVEKFFISLGHVFKCHQCSGHGKIRCQKCGGKVRWKDGGKEHVCDCGDGKQDCPECSGFGQMLKVLRVDTSYYFDEITETEYSGALPGSLITVNSGNVIFRHISEFKKQVIAEALDGFEPDEFNRLKIDMQSELKREVAEKVAGQLVDPNILNNLIDDYCNKLPNPVTANKRLQEEVLPVRMKCEVTDVPVKAVKYEYKGKDYSLIVYGNDGQVWVDGNQPAEFTWKVATILVIVLGVLWFITR
ncbi:MAG: hypothetical protein KKD46_03060 [Euryarchaeota archaeon]|nr:hypothetical protein [Euryarchaeota archaeon]MCG2738301.1 hypothetical protein [Candidatus Methanoperedenaceae archaeon]